MTIQPAGNTSTEHAQASTNYLKTAVKAVGVTAVVAGVAFAVFKREAIAATLGLKSISFSVPTALAGLITLKVALIGGVILGLGVLYFGGKAVFKACSSEKQPPLVHNTQDNVGNNKGKKPATVTDQPTV